MYDEKKATEEAYEANLTKEIIPSYWIDLDKIDTFSDTSSSRHSSYAASLTLTTMLTGRLM